MINNIIINNIIINTVIVCGGIIAASSFIMIVLAYFVEYVDEYVQDSVWCQVADDVASYSCRIFKWVVGGAMAIVGAALITALVVFAPYVALTAVVLVAILSSIIIGRVAYLKYLQRNTVDQDKETLYN